MACSIASGVRDLEPDEPGPAAPLDLAAQPSSWPPAERRAFEEPRDAQLSSLPPVLDPRALGALPSPIPQAPLPREALREEAAPPSQSGGGAASPAKPRPPAMLAKDFTSSRSAPTWSTAETAKLIAVVTLPAILAFGALSFVPALATPVGRALRGDSTLASGALAVVALVSAAALCARSMLGEKSRWLYVAAAGNVLFGIVMIIVTFAASEAAALGVPHSMGGVSTLVAPIAPLALALGALVEGPPGMGRPLLSRRGAPLRRARERDALPGARAQPRGRRPDAVTDAASGPRPPRRLS